MSNKPTVLSQEELVTQQQAELAQTQEQENQLNAELTSEKRQLDKAREAGENIAEREAAWLEKLRRVQELADKRRLLQQQLTNVAT